MGVVDGYRAKDGSSKANVTFPDGKKLFLVTPGPGAPGDAQEK